ncbi:hypothetical protein ERJ75_000219500 [Trypanosoma vivax]|uniref:Uncharacterized protein n=1 Tax=Trypanosoma vivax (strain Y486) TaxID=1055687 RepID=F9WSF9_TRYVY|nr:hypothetical protein TRVL_03149 [Trypanosoma vivax]KAH8619038.1 hypothetical protein ERJ75_000219500 [Trypanosoma vivax]CCD20498.1 hypothetical protein, conserved [Trypanosoma vivax Y486]|eukprot:CCD20498.1 hypothetical protein, conserved [Trypanosoma vivax Y486]
MTEAEVFRLNLEVEAAAARNANLSRQLEQLNHEISFSAIHSAARTSCVSEGTQTECRALYDVAINLDDLLFEVAEMMYRMYPASSVDLSIRRGCQLNQLVELSQRCLREIRTLRSACETKLDGYSKLIDDLQRSHGDYYRSMEMNECQLRDKERECESLAKQNALLSKRCADLEAQLKASHNVTGQAEEEISRLLRRVAELEADRQRLLDNEVATANTLAALRADCFMNPWSGASMPKDPSPAHHSRGSLTHAAAVSVTTASKPRATSAIDVLWACGGQASGGSPSGSCVPHEKVVDYCCREKLFHGSDPT